MAQVITNGTETFKDLKGNVYARPGSINRGDIVGVVGIDKSIEITGVVKNIQTLNREIWATVEVGGVEPIPRRINELAVPI